MTASEALVNHSTNIAEEGLQGFARDYVDQLCAHCGRFLRWEREHVLRQDPTERALAEHRRTLQWLLRAARLVQAVAADPDFPDAFARVSLTGVIWQLEESWKAVYEALPEAEARRQDLSGECGSGEWAEGREAYSADLHSPDIGSWAHTGWKRGPNFGCGSAALCFSAFSASRR